ncbi:DegV family protein with EDD domain [Arthrobacter stackebrandtii]|uniref:DegV family protein with EDD domain n=1 Tax=Arthrobacter stackebrandtii TaxID=272161 RepID=A0ABS4Z073_9MICC|nr:DegV family protein [Arthrobacter stackebrandtii]MBP2414429.1 DegV family protein with EDD domain [Arthrobacter stackebrandtii]PYH01558.1 fatty acid-binding protein DegV [Arthrobacter stackebrandtii]
MNEKDPVPGKGRAAETGATPEKGAARNWLRQQVGRMRPRAAQQEPKAGAPPKPRIAVVTDSAAALPPEWVAGISLTGLLTVVPIPVIIGDNVYSDDDVELETHISLALASGKPVKTSRPSPGQFERAFRQVAAAGFDEIVSVHLSTKLSGTFEAAMLGAERSPIPVHVLNSGTVGMGQGTGVQAAVAASLLGHGVPAVVQECNRAVAATATYFYVPSLEQLRRGGRISLASSWLGTVLDIKPLLGIRDGGIVPLEKVRSAPKAVARLQEMAAADIAARGPEATQISIHHFGNEAQALALGESLELASPGLAAATLTRLPAVLAAHAGLGVLVVVVADALIPPQEEPDAG